MLVTAIVSKRIETKISLIATSTMCKIDSFLPCPSILMVVNVLLAISVFGCLEIDTGKLLHK